MIDKYGREIDYLRISLTDRCNLRCIYCMPEEGVKSLSHAEILTYDEILRICRCAADLGIRKIKLTGGEPLVRKGCASLAKQIKAIPGIEKVTLTTNGILLAEQLDALLDAGIDAINISLDTLRPEVFAKITRRPLYQRVETGIEKLRGLGMENIKFNCVPIEGVNEGEIPDLVGLARDHAVKVRFIELMPIGCAYEVGYKGVAMDRVRRAIESAYGPLKAAGRKAGGVNGPAVYYRLPGFKGQVGFIDAMEHKFCSSCNRVRLTAEGFLKLCLNAKTGLDIRQLLRSGIRDDNLKLAIYQAIYHKPKEHFFLDKHNEARDSRAMVQVGG